MSAFATYEREFSASLESINDKVSQWKGSKGTRLASEIDNELEILWDTVDSMDKASRSAFGEEELRKKVQNYKTQAASAEKKWTTSRGKARVGARTDVILEATSSRIDDIRSLATENEEIGQTARERLQEDRERLEGSLDRVEELGDDVSVAGSYISRMSRRAITNKAILYGVIAILVLSIVTVVFMRWVYPKISHTPTTNTTKFD